jgi:ribonuclease P protein component
MGDAVERNRAKRLVRELFRHNKPGTSVDVVIVPRREMLEAPFDRIEAEYRSLLSKPSRSKAANV